MLACQFVSLISYRASSLYLAPFRLFIEREKERKRKRNLNIALMTHDETLEFPFGFPYEPYTIQVQFMEQLQSALAASALATFESPTGTGKSLSALCGTLDWLHRKYILKEEENKALATEKNTLSGEPDWIKTFRKRKALEDIMPQPAPSSMSKSIHLAYEPQVDTIDDELESLLQELDGTSSLPLLPTHEAPVYIKNPTPKMKAEAKRSTIPRVYYCARTHSQLAQTFAELSKILDRYKSWLRPMILGSRKSLCLHPDWSHRTHLSAEALNEACDTLQLASSPSQQCPFLAQKTEAQWSVFRTSLAASGLLDLEDLAAIGRSHSLCPYYGSHHGLLDAQLIGLTYASLLTPSIRASLELELKDSIILFDECHHLIPTLSEIYSPSLTLRACSVLESSLVEYLASYASRLLPENRVKIETLLQTTKKLIKYLSNPSNQKGR